MYRIREEGNEGLSGACKQMDEGRGTGAMHKSTGESHSASCAAFRMLQAKYSVGEARRCGKGGECSL